jgi:hypothetical protein
MRISGVPLVTTILKRDMHQTLGKNNCLNRIFVKCLSSTNWKSYF